MQRLMDLVRRLRAPDGCPWDRAQTARSYRHCLVEECREVVLAIERGDAENLREELGDALFALAFLVGLQEEAGETTLDEVIDGAVEKMIRRHPHVFGDAVASTPEEALAAFAAAKEAERA